MSVHVHVRKEHSGGDLLAAQPDLSAGPAIPITQKPMRGTSLQQPFIADCDPDTDPEGLPRTSG